MKNISVFFSNSSKLQCQELLYLTDVEIHINYPASWLEIDKFADKNSVCVKRLFFLNKVTEFEWVQLLSFNELDN